VRIERQRGLELFSPIAFSLSRSRSAGVQPSLARNVDRFSTDRDLTDWVYPAEVHNHTWVGVRLSRFPKRVPFAIVGSFLSPIGLGGPESGVSVETRFGDRLVSCTDPLPMFVTNRTSTEDQDLLSCFIEVNRCARFALGRFHSAWNTIFFPPIAL
jgi:hypothetical protein